MVFRTLFFIAPLRKIKKAITLLPHLGQFFALHLQLKNIQCKFKILKSQKILNLPPIPFALVRKPWFRLIFNEIFTLVVILVLNCMIMTDSIKLTMM